MHNLFDFLFNCGHKNEEHVDFSLVAFFEANEAKTNGFSTHYFY